MIINSKGYTLKIDSKDLEEIITFAFDAGYYPTGSGEEGMNPDVFMETWIEGELKITGCKISEGYVFVNVNKD